MTYCGFCVDAALSKKTSHGLLANIGKSFLIIVYKALKSKVICRVVTYPTPTLPISWRGHSTLSTEWRGSTGVRKNN